MPRRRTNAEWSDRTRAALLKAAKSAYIRHGYSEASLDTVAAEARVTKGAIYHHYGDKRGLFRAVFEALEHQMVAHIEKIAGREKTAVESVQRGCEAFLDFVGKESVARILLADGPSVLGWHAWRAIDSSVGGRSLRAGLEAGMRAGEIRRMNLAALATLLNGALNEAAMAIAESKDPVRERRAVIATLRRLLDGLRVPAGERET